MNVTFKIYVKILMAILVFAPCIAGAQVKPRVAGLGDNAEYMRLLEREQELSRRGDSLGRVITQLREEFRANPGDRQTFATRILQLENEVFDIRNQAGIVASKVSGIEEAFILNNLQSRTGETVETGSKSVQTGEQSANLVRNDVFRKLLPGEDYASLLRAQAGEHPAGDMLLRYLENYDKIAVLGKAYAAAGSATVADSIFSRYLALDKANNAIADSLASEWHEIFDNKLFAYNYLLQTQNQPRLLARMEAAGRDARDEIARRRAGAASGEVISYFEQKELIFEYETALAGMFGLSMAADSLGRANGVFKQLKRPLPDQGVEERLFIEYADIAAHNPAKYNATNPIPEVEVYQRGLIYRIMAGSYPARQAVSVFKGLAPLAYSQEGGKWFYYAGGFADFTKVEAAVEDMKKRGFRTAKIVVWNNGRALVLDDKPLANTVYRVEISGSDTNLSDKVRAAISAVGSGVDISRSGDSFIVGPFSTAFDAEKVADAVRKADPAISVRTVVHNP